jgi:hypothetical protein
MRRRIFLIPIVFLLVVLFPLSSMAKPEVTQVPGLGLGSVEKMKPNGEYHIYTWEDGTWQKTGSLLFDRFFREQELDLSPFVNGEGQVRIRLVQQGGGAAHIDAVFLGGKPARKLKGKKEGMILRKLSRKDFDVIDSFNRTIELVFPKDGKDKTLRLTARVEGEQISKTPFQFPGENLYKTMDKHSRFYPYKPGPRDGREPFFSEYSPTGSGHPSGFTYGWVSSDEKNLYVTIDFTPDNTMDGEKDYAKVYVKTGEELKEFKVSVPETSWGKAEFTYTDKVTYQHKVYDFTIPLKEFGIEEIRKDKELLLAFSAYGTASPPGNYTPVLAYDSINNRYLVAYSKVVDLIETTHIYGQLLNADGTAYGSEFAISTGTDSQYNPSVAYDSVNQRFLVVWSDWRNYDTTNTDIYGQVVNADGSLYGSNFAISTDPDFQRSPSVAYDSANEKFLVTWDDDRNTNTTSIDIYGQLVNADGSLFNFNFAISTFSGIQRVPSVAYDSVNGRFLVVWEDLRNFNLTFPDIFGQLVNANGSLFGSNFAISTNPDFQRNSSVAYDSVNQRFLVAWEDFRNRNTTSYDIYGQLVNANGSLYGTAANFNFAISTGTDFQTNPSVAYDSAHQRFLVAWEDFRNRDTTGYDIYGQVVNANGSLHDSDFAISTPNDAQFEPSVAFNSDCENFLVAFETYAVDDIAFTLVGVCSPGCPDAYEPDNNSSQATVLLSGVPQIHSICPVGDEDWYTLTITSESEVVIETSGPSGDTRMWLYDSSLNEIEYNDDFNGLWSRIDRNCDTDALTPGTYYVQIDEYLSDREIEIYDISLTSTPCACTIDTGDILNLVTWYYQSILDREPELGGAEGWTAEIERIVSLGIDIKEGFIALGKLFFNSEEYLAMGTTDGEYIIDLYETFLDRTPSVGEVADWEAELAGGLTRNLLLNYFSFAEEFRVYMEGRFGSCLTRPEYALVNDLYRGFLARLPDNDGFNSWLTLMQVAQCTGAQAVRDLTNQIGLDFIHSPEYMARNPEFLDPPDNLIIMLLIFMMQYSGEGQSLLVILPGKNNTTVILLQKRKYFSLLLILMSFKAGFRKS